ncbi:MAG: tail fiber protein [Ahniella sp.]|nr:tail fiber protein [Ahniella sp.]
MIRPPRMPRMPAGSLSPPMPYPGPAAPIGSVCLYAGDLQSLSTTRNTAWKCAEDGAAAPASESLGVPLLTEATAWLPCDGRSVLTRAFPELYKVLGTIYGAGDADHFNLPDLRGAFVRGVDNGAGVDPDLPDRYAPDGSQYDGVGSLQCDAFQTHQHTYDTAIGATVGDKGPAFAVKQEAKTRDPVTGRVSDFETRPKNMAFNFIIRVPHLPVGIFSRKREKSFFDLINQISAYPTDYFCLGGSPPVPTSLSGSNANTRSSDRVLSVRSSRTVTTSDNSQRPESWVTCNGDRV